MNNAPKYLTKLAEAAHTVNCLAKRTIIRALPTPVPMIEINGMTFPYDRSEEPLKFVITNLSAMVKARKIKDVNFLFDYADYPTEEDEQELMRKCEDIIKDLYKPKIVQ